MRNTLDFVRSRLRQMPYGLRLLSKILLISTFGFPAIAVLSILTHGSHGHYYSINGQEVTYGEFMRQGGLVEFFLFGIYCAILVYGLLHASRWSGPLCFLPFLVSFLLAVFHPHPPASATFRDCLLLILQLGILAWYLFYRGTVTGYYSKPFSGKI